tara:strand:+ start:173 stop:487 length:315 start_codon:yes stop_codon:yes gene_type:complete
MSFSLAKWSDQTETPPVGLPSFNAYVYVPLTESKGQWLEYEVSAVSATDACLKAAYTAVRRGHIRQGEQVNTYSETDVFSVVRGHRWTRAERIVTPTGRTGGAK